MEFFKFELRFWTRGFMVYIFLGIVALLFGFATGSDNVQVGEAIGNTHRNAPYVIMQYYVAAGLLAALMVSAIYDSAASRDFATKFSDVLFSKPIGKWNYLVGRFTAATVIALIPSLGISIGMILAGAIPNLDAERWGPVRWDAHALGMLVFALPNTLLVGSVVFAIAAWTRNTMYSFLGVLMLMVAYGISQTILSDINNETLAMLVDPLGGAPYSVLTKYWTVDQRNHWVLPTSGILILNRVIWLIVALVIFALAGWRFSFETGRVRSRKATESSGDLKIENCPVLGEWPKVTPQTSWYAQLRSCTRLDIFAVMRTPAFIVILLAAMLNTSVGLFMSATEGYGLSSFPVTYKMVDIVRGALFGFLIPVIIYFVGVLVWRDRDSKMQEIIGAAPVPNSVFVVSRLVSLLTLILSILTVTILLSCSVQLFYGFTRLQPGVYAFELILIETLRFGFFIVLAMLAHTFSPNKYVGYFAFIVILILNAFFWQWIRIDSIMVRFGRLPTYVYSDMFGVAPYVSGLVAHALYWLAGAAVLLWICSIAMHRGVPKSIRSRLTEGIISTSTASKAFVGFSALTMFAQGAWLVYNTQFLNSFIGSVEQEKRRVRYENEYSKFENAPQPKVTSVQYEIDIYPETRNMRMAGKQSIANKSDTAIDTLYVNLAPTYETTLEIPNAKLERDDKQLACQTYRLQPALEPGQSIDMSFVVQSKTRGIENQVSNQEINQNGSFFNNSIAPHFGYDPDRRIMDPNKRKEYKLEPAESVPILTRECGVACQSHYVAQDADWVNVETIISTSGDQIAVAPGSLIEKWNKDGRNFFKYKLDHPSLNFYSFISARYEVERSKSGDIDVEVYYHPEHSWNVPRMSQSIKAALDYCGTEFGPYRHKQARIIEFPRVASFAQAFPGTMPYSESIGFIARLNKPDDIDMVFYVVAHEMAHQWWAHQVVGARMQGATLLSETLAQYTALMIMRKEYGPDMMHKFLKYEMDAYLRSRGAERLKERPLISVDPSQGYIHYRKGSVALYYLAEMIGEKRINAALKDIIEAYAYQGPPYPTSHALVDRLRKQTPEELQYLIKDLFEDITIFANRTIDAKATKQGDGKYLVQVEVECSKFKADEKGLETEAEMDDWMEIGAFAKPDAGKRYGELLHRERVQLTSGKHKLEFTVDSKPFQAGIDPRNFLIDRMPDDNMKKIIVE
ncbi:MAG: M1 family aminopeptidase [Planctomycetota bacterium]|nr:M1 family aminopeptidase [Planctomycetota bacterium]